MKHFIIKHNWKKMGYSLDTVTDLIAFTDKKVKDENIGSKVWLITSEEKPKQYLLKMYFLIANIQIGEEKNFKTKLIGIDGKILPEMKRIDDLPWFEEFREQMAYFVGFSEIKQQKYTIELEKLI